MGDEVTGDKVKSVSRANAVSVGREASSGRAAILRFEDLAVWQAARELTRGVYRACQTQKLKADAALATQMRRSAVSICSNIAEGFERGTRKQQIEDQSIFH